MKSDLEFIFATMGYMEYVFSSFYFIKQIFVSEDVPEKQVEMAWYQFLWMKFLDFIITVWQYRLAFMRDVILVTVAGMMLYLLWKIIKKQTSNENLNGSASAPTIYNNTMSIHLWLNELNEFIESKRINSEQEKQATVLNHLDKTSKNIIKKLIDDKRIKNFRELESYLKSFFGNHNVSSSDSLFQFVTRKQLNSESLAQYYQVMQDLAIKAYPKTPKDTLEEYINEYFIKGLNNRALREQMVLTKLDKKSDVLGNAIEMQSKLACLTETNNAIENYIQFVDANNNTSNNYGPSCNNQNNHNQQQNQNNQHHQNNQNLNQQWTSNGQPQHSNKNDNSPNSRSNSNQRRHEPFNNASTNNRSFIDNNNNQQNLNQQSNVRYRTSNN